MKKFFLLQLCSFVSVLLLAAPPANYYLSAEGQSTAALKTALFNIIKDPSVTGYSGLWNAFRTTDRRADGKVWDMYSDVPNGSSSYSFTFGSDQCGSSGYVDEGDCYNREHSFPKSWFGGEVAPMYTDLYHLYPTDGYVNEKRGNLPFGEVGTPTYTSSNGSKVGRSSFSGYVNPVFEPIDAYKGDFARTYFYMVTCYENKVSNWSSAQITQNTYPSLSAWSINLLLKWHRQDPVSAKEIARNDAVQNTQSNRNPFIDHPELAEYIWGSLKGQPWYNNSAVEETVMTTLALYPNPAGDYVIVEAATIEPIAYAVFNVSGLQMLSGISENGSRIDVSSLQTGVYIVSLTIDSQRVQRCIVITK